MKIAIDASRSAKEFKTGTEHYSTQIILHLAKIDQVNDYTLYSPKELGPEFNNLPSNFKIVVIPFPRLWSQIRLSFETIKNRKADVWFFPAHTIPVIAPKHSVTTIHDLGFKYYPELYTPFERFYHNWCLNFSVKHAKKIIAISQFTKNDILKHYVIKPSKIDVIYHGFDKSLYKPVEDKTIDSPVDGPYMFYIGRVERKKNIKNLVEAFALLRSERSIKHKLVLGGKPGYGYEEIRETIDKQKKEIRDDIIELGYMKEEDVARYMQHADIFVFPSNFEGFGMPIIQSMACGTPVIATNGTSIPEVAGDAAYLTTNKPFDLSVGMSKLIHDKKLNQTLIKKGLERADEFSWEKAASETLETLMKASRKK